MSFFKAPKKIIQEIITFLYGNLQEHVMLGAMSRKNEKKTYIWWKDLQLAGLNVEGIWAVLQEMCTIELD